MYKSKIFADRRNNEGKMVYADEWFNEWIIEHPYIEIKHIAYTTSATGISSFCIIYSYNESDKKKYLIDKQLEIKYSKMTNEEIEHELEILKTEPTGSIQENICNAKKKLILNKIIGEREGYNDYEF